MGSGGPRGLQILPSGGSPVRGGFDSHTFPPCRAAIALAIAAQAFVLLPSATEAQEAPSDTAVVDSVTADSLVVPLSEVAPAPGAAAAPQERGFWSKPTGVMLRSLILPGWGQATNDQWIKAGIAVAVEGTLLAGIIADTAELNDLAEEDPRRSDVIDDRQAKWWWLGGAVFLSMVDAYVSAHLRDFDIAPEPVSLQDGGVGLGARVSFAYP